MIRKALVAGAMLLGMVTSAHAAIIPTLESVSGGPGAYTFNYQGTLAGDQGVTKGSELVIYDFAGYVNGSIFSSSPFIAASVENSTNLITPPGVTDNPLLPNLVFTWMGPDYNTSGGPFPETDFNGIGAISTFGGLADGFFGAKAVKNNGLPPGGAGTLTLNTGFVSVPGAVPEPATWALMIVGAMLTGGMLRRRRLVVGAPA